MINRHGRQNHCIYCMEPTTMNFIATYSDEFMFFLMSMEEMFIKLVLEWFFCLLVWEEFSHVGTRSVTELN